MQTRRKNEKLEYMSLGSSKDFFKKSNASLIGIQAYTSTYRNDKLLRNMPNHCSEVGWNSQWNNVLVHDLVNGERSISASWLTVRALPKNEAFYFSKCPIELECTHHSVNAVWVFTHIFNKQYSVLKIRIINTSR